MYVPPGTDGCSSNGACGTWYEKEHRYDSDSINNLVATYLVYAAAAAAVYVPATKHLLEGSFSLVYPHDMRRQYQVSILAF